MTAQHQQWQWQRQQQQLREPKIDTELVYAYAKTNRLHHKEDFLCMTNVADILEVREKCFEDELYQVARLLFTNISNGAHLATMLIYLGKNQAAVKSARKVGNTQWVWPITGTTRCLLKYQSLEASTCMEKSEFHLVCSLCCDGVPADDIARCKFVVWTSSTWKNSQHFFKLTNTMVTLMKSLHCWKPLWVWNVFMWVITFLQAGGFSDLDSQMGTFAELSILYSKYKPSQENVRDLHSE